MAVLGWTSRGVTSSPTALVTPVSGGLFGGGDTGSFFFDDPDNIELVVKVLGACGFTNTFWVFAAAATDVEYTVTVTDTETNNIRTYSNPLGHAATAVTDTSAFATCP